MKHISFLIAAFLSLIILLSVVDRRLSKASHGFCLHVIEAPIPGLPDRDLATPFPRELFSEPFYYLGRGAQSFVFESSDGSTVLKFYRYPSHLRRFCWIHHPFGYIFSQKRKQIKEHNIERLRLSFHSFFLAARSLRDETGVLYAHLQPTSHLEQKVQLIDKIGAVHTVSLDSVAFIVQKKGKPFLTVFKQELSKGNLDQCRLMIDSLIDMIMKRCHHRITDLDDMKHDNYGWLHQQAIHLDIGRFQEKESLKDPSEVREEILRVASPLLDYLSQTSPELHSHFLSKIS